MKKLVFMMSLLIFFVSSCKSDSLTINAFDKEYTYNASQIDGYTLKYGDELTYRVSLDDDFTLAYYEVLDSPYLLGTYNDGSSVELKINSNDADFILKECRKNEINYGDKNWNELYGIIFNYLDTVRKEKEIGNMNVNLSEEVLKEMTSDDSSLNNYRISKYSNNVYVTDDIITKIVPKECFFTEGEFAFSGAEYFFYINTTKLALDELSFYISNVYVADIDLTQTNTTSDYNGIFPKNTSYLSIKFAINEIYFGFENSDLLEDVGVDNNLDKVVVHNSNCKISSGIFIGEDIKFDLKNVTGSMNKLYDGVDYNFGFEAMYLNLLNKNKEALEFDNNCKVFIDYDYKEYVDYVRKISGCDNSLFDLTNATYTNFDSIYLNYGDKKQTFEGNPGQMFLDSDTNTPRVFSAKFDSFKGELTNDVYQYSIRLETMCKVGDVEMLPYECDYGIVFDLIRSNKLVNTYLWINHNEKTYFGSYTEDFTDSLTFYFPIEGFEAVNCYLSSSDGIKVFDVPEGYKLTVYNLDGEEIARSRINNIIVNLEKNGKYFFKLEAIEASYSKNITIKEVDCEFLDDMNTEFTLDNNDRYKVFKIHSTSEYQAYNIKLISSNQDTKLFVYNAFSLLVGDTNDNLYIGLGEGEYYIVIETNSDTICNVKLSINKK